MPSSFLLQHLVHASTIDRQFYPPLGIKFREGKDCNYTGKGIKACLQTDCIKQCVLHLQTPSITLKKPMTTPVWQAATEGSWV